MYKYVDLSKVDMVYAMESYLDTPICDMGGGVSLESFCDMTFDEIAMEGIGDTGKSIAKTIFHVIQVVWRALKKSVMLLVSKVIRPLKALRIATKQDIRVNKDLIAFLSTSYPKLTRIYSESLTYINTFVTAVSSSAASLPSVLKSYSFVNYSDPLRSIRLDLRKIDMSKKDGVIAKSDLDRIINTCTEMYKKSEQMYSRIRLGGDLEKFVTENKDGKWSRMCAELSISANSILETCICIVEFCNQILGNNRERLNPYRNSETINQKDDDSARQDKEFDEWNEKTSAATQKYLEEQTREIRKAFGL